MTRLWLVAVVCSRSSASITTSTAESNPNVVAVASRSLSIVLGTPMQLMPASCSCCAVTREPSPPTIINVYLKLGQYFFRICNYLCGHNAAIAGAGLGYEMAAIRRSDDRAAQRHDSINP